MASASHTPWLQTSVLAAPIRLTSGLSAPQTASVDSLNGAVTESPRMESPIASSPAFSITSSQKSPKESAWNGR